MQEGMKTNTKSMYVGKSERIFAVNTTTTPCGVLNVCKLKYMKITEKRGGTLRRK